MYTPFEYAGSVPQATMAKLDRIIIEESDVTIQYLEGYMDNGAFVLLGAAHVNMTPAEYAGYGDAKAALEAKLTPAVSPDPVG